jgi:biopolymer transport protein ExbD
MKFKTNLKIAPNMIDLTPLVDVIFLMLIFFVVTSDTLPLKSLNIVNPVLDRDTTPLTTQILVVTDSHNVIYVGSKKDIVDLSSLRNQLESEIALHKQQYPQIEPTVVLSIDQRVEYGLFLQIFSIAQQCSPRLRLVYRPQGLESGHLNAEA